MLDLLVLDREQRTPQCDGVDLVWTGPEPGDVASRDTAVVVRELFQNATESVLIAGYAVYRGHVVFRTLADRMEEAPGLRVRMFLDVRRPPGDTSSESEVVRRFGSHFRSHDWPGQRLPEVYYDPRSLESASSRRASLHAKCVVVDEESLFVSSANFTEAAQMRNIEVGVLIRSSLLARQLVGHFESLSGRGSLRPVPLG
jgi:phosphatidylserine/phosphatidylglycerophosphate/cardiolipin synthase-like enzyme